MKNPCKIYVLYTGVFCKIGITSRPIEDRIKEIQTNCPLPINRCVVFKGYGKTEAHRLEIDIQEHLSAHHSHGEWFRQFEGISKSVSYILQKKSTTVFTRKAINLKSAIFEDLSIRMSYKIKNAAAFGDITTLSSIYTQLTCNDKDYNETRFILFAKESLYKLVCSSIRYTIKSYTPQQKSKAPAVVKKFFIISEDVAKNKKQLKSIKKVNNSPSIQAIYNRIDKEKCNGN